MIGSIPNFGSRFPRQTQQTGTGTSPGNLSITQFLASLGQPTPGQAQNPQPQTPQQVTQFWETDISSLLADLLKQMQGSQGTARQVNNRERVRQSGSKRTGDVISGQVV
jgi:hypothetical protein